MPSSGLALKNKSYPKYATPNGNKPADATDQVDSGTLRAADPVKDFI